MNQLTETKQEDALFFRENGYCIGRNIILPEHCRELIALFQKEVKPFGGMILRSTTALREIHYFSESGLMTNPILNVHDMDQVLFTGFTQKAISMLAANTLQKAVTSLIQDKPVLVQSVFYESSMGSYLCGIVIVHRCGLNNRWCWSFFRAFSHPCFGRLLW